MIKIIWCMLLASMSMSQSANTPKTDDLVQPILSTENRDSYLDAVFAGYEPKYKTAAVFLKIKQEVEAGEFVPETGQIATTHALIEALESNDLAETEQLELAQFYEKHFTAEVLSELKALLISKYEKQLRIIAKPGADSEALGALLLLDSDSLRRISENIAKSATLFLGSRVADVQLTNFRITMSQLHVKINVNILERINPIKSTWPNNDSFLLTPSSALKTELQALKKRYVGYTPTQRLAICNAVDMRRTEKSTIEKDFLRLEKYCDVMYRLEQRETQKSADRPVTSTVCDILHDINIPQLVLLVQLGKKNIFSSELTEHVYTDMLKSLNPYPELKQRIKKNLASNFLVTTLNAPREVTHIIVGYLDRIPGNKKKKRRTQSQATICVIS